MLSRGVAVALGDSKGKGSGATNDVHERNPVGGDSGFVFGGADAVVAAALLSILVSGVADFDSFSSPCCCSPFLSSFFLVAVAVVLSLVTFSVSSSSSSGNTSPNSEKRIGFVHTH